MLTDASVLISSASCTCAAPMERNSRRMLPACIGMALGNQATNAAAAATPITVTAQKVERQPIRCPKAVPNGTPSTLATVSPVNISATACARLSRGTSSAATTAPMPKNAAWQNAVTTRAAISNA